MIFEFLKLQHLLLDMDKGILKISDLELGRAYAMPLKSYTHEIAILWYITSEILSVPLTTPPAPIGGPSASLEHQLRSEKQWAGVTTLLGWHVYPLWEPQNLAQTVLALGHVIKNA